jgi:hypothetical protein
MPDTSLTGTMLTEGSLNDSEIAQRLKEATEATQRSRNTASVDLDFGFPVPEHPVIWPEAGFIEFVSFSFPPLSTSQSFIICLSNFERDGVSRWISSLGPPGATAKRCGCEGGEP